LLQNPAQLLKEEPEFFLSFTMILSVNSPPDFDLALSDLLWSGELSFPHVDLVHSLIPFRDDSTASNNESMNPDIPLIAVRNSGFVGKMRLQYRQHCSKSTITR
jgi:amyloid beta precursor protein binding protein 1